MAVQWNSSIATSSDEIDLQHKELFKRVDGLLAAVGRGTDREETSQIIQYLTDYVVFISGTKRTTWPSMLTRVPWPIRPSTNSL